MIDKEQAPLNKRKTTFDWTRYSDLQEINVWLQSLETLYPNDVNVFSIGNSYEGRSINGLRLNIGGGAGKKQIIFEGTIHAREWISTATVTWILNEFLTSQEPEVRAIAATYEWFFFPVVNVDGFSYTWSTDRLWRKTRKPSTNLLCVGVDPNRNWDNHFNEFGSSSNPCSDIYAGQYPFSEPETRQLSEFIASLENLVGYFDFHAYGQLLMLPYGWTKELVDNYQELYEIGLIGAEALRLKFGTQYQVGSIANIICVYFYTKFYLN